MARRFGGELVSADSRQLYRGMDIATGKDSAAVGSTALWMIDVVDPGDEFSVSQYVAGARAAIADIHTRGKLPIVVGGTGFYIQGLLHPLDTIDIPPNHHLRKQLARASLSEVTRRLMTLDPQAWKDMNASDRANPRRLIRKIEILTARPRVPSAAAAPAYDSLIIGLTAPYEELYRRIDDRVDKRMVEGVLEEVQRLLDAGYSWNLPSMSGLGYRQWYGYFTGNRRDRAALLPSIVKQWKFDEHAYARRQMTWFRKMPAIDWVDIRLPDVADIVARKVGAWYTEHRDFRHEN